MRLRRIHFGEWIFLTGLLLATALVASIRAPAFRRDRDDFRYSTIAYAKALPPATEPLNPAIRFTAGVNGTIAATDEAGRALWMFQTAVTDSNLKRVFLQRTAHSLLAAGEAGNLYEFYPDGRLRASVRVGWQVMGPPESSAGTIRVPVLDGPGQTPKLRLIDAVTFRVVADAH